MNVFGQQVTVSRMRETVYQRERLYLLVLPANWEVNLGSHTCQTRALPLSYSSSPIFTHFIIELEGFFIYFRYSTLISMPFTNIFFYSGPFFSTSIVSSRPYQLKLEFGSQKRTKRPLSKFTSFAVLVRTQKPNKQLNCFP